MKALCLSKYGPLDDLFLQEVEKPIPKDDEVLIKVKGTSINFNSLILIKGKPFVGRFFSGLFKPGLKIPGNDVAGIVESSGKDVNKFKPGDEVFGDLAEFGFGTFAEYVTAPEKALILKPAFLTFDEAAAVPEAGLVALQALKDHGNIHADQKVLINGASGGIGTFAVQIAKHFGAEVTAVCSSRNFELVQSLGADNIIDYTKEDFIKKGPGFDLIISTIGYRPIKDYKKALNPKGVYIATGGTMPQIFQAMLFGPLLSERDGKRLGNMAVKPNKDLDFLTGLMESGAVKSIIDKTFPLANIVNGLKHYDTGQASGKIIITV
jgi:NADPH:quinone reductase-like Zn-dependent oxidoreductase